MRHATSGDVLIQRARLPDDRLADVLVRAGHIAAIGPALAVPQGVPVLAAEGRTLLPGFVDSHLHLDKTLMGERWIPLPEAEGVAGRCAASDWVLAHIAQRSTAERAAALVRSALVHGTTALRSHVDVTPHLGLTAVEALLTVREEFAGLVDIQLVAFPQHGVLRSPGVEALLDAALRLGVEVVGGIDPAGFDEDVEGHLRCLFRLATKHRAAIDIHLHDPGALGGYEIARIAAWTRAEGLEGRVAISHAFALGELPESETRPLIEALAAAQITIVTNGPGHRTPPPLHDLWAAGVRVAIGSDNVRDAWWPWGTGDMLERAFLVAYRAGLRTDPELRRVLEAATTDGAALLGLGPYGVIEGAPADLVLVDATCAPEAVAAHPPRRTVLKRGRVAAVDGALSA